MATKEPVTTENRCMYTNAQCPNPRGRKKNGELHRLCDDHRQRENEAQQRMTKKRAQKRRSEGIEPSEQPMTLTLEDLEALQLLSD